MDPLDIGSRLELFVDNYLIEAISGDASLKLHSPQRKEVALVFDQPWEGNTCGYVTVFRDFNCFRMYYRGSHATYLTELPPRPILKKNCMKPCSWRWRGFRAG